VPEEEERLNVLETKDRRNTNELRDELPLLRARARDIEIRIDQLNRRIAEIQRRPVIIWPIAVIDREKCLGCGLCENVCPVGAIAVKKTALVTSLRCNGCGRCVTECPQGAITLVSRTKPSSQNNN
jgi:ferredoxin